MSYFIEQIIWFAVIWLSAIISHELGHIIFVEYFTKKKCGLEFNVSSIRVTGVHQYMLNVKQVVIVYLAGILAGSWVIITGNIYIIFAYFFACSGDINWMFKFLGTKRWNIPAFYIEKEELEEVEAKLKRGGFL